VVCRVGNAEGWCKRKVGMEMISQIMTQIPKEYKIATQAICIMPASSQTSKMVQQVYVDLWNAKYKNKAQVNGENMALYTNSSHDGKPWKWCNGNCNYCGIQGHKVADCHKKKAAENNPNNDKPNIVSENTDKTKDTHAEEKKLHFKCKQMGHLAKNCPKKKPKTVNAFFVGMALSMNDDENLDNLCMSSEDDQNNMTLCMDIELEVRCMTLCVDHPSLERELVCLLLGVRKDIV